MLVKRSLRVAEVIKKDLSDILREDVRDPGINMLTITRVIVSPDLKMAKIYLSILGDASAREETLQALERAKSFIRTALGKRGQFRNVPELRFFHDDTMDYVFAIENLIQKAKEKDEIG
ncbi:30S ribosome-binding factor RbfA [candidate division KSB1 bacterium]|nr:30S ribosome-binding factor RbfA [candidate division KSB1 bacterium]